MSEGNEFGTVEARRGKFRAKWRENGARESRTFETRAEAVVFLAGRAEEARRAHVDARPMHGSRTLAEFADDVLSAWTLALRPETVRSRRLIVRRAGEFFGRKPMGEVNATDARGFIAFLVRRGTHAAATVHHERQVLSSAWSLAIADGLATSNPWTERGLSRFMPRVERKEAARIAPAALDALFASIASRSRLAAMLAGDAGLRRGEVCALRRADVAPDCSSVTVRAEVAKSHRARVVPTTPRLAAALRAEFDARPALPEARVYGLSGWTFCGDLGRASAGLHPHALRHAFARALHDAGVSLLVIKELLGHASLAMTERYLGHSADGAPSAAIAALAASRAPTPARRPRRASSE